MSDQVQVKAAVKINAYSVIDEVVERSIRYGIHRAHKHVENPTEESLINEIHRAVMNDLCDVLIFEET